MMNNFQSLTHLVRSFRLNAMDTTRPNTHTPKDFVPELGKAANSAHMYQVTVGVYGVKFIERMLDSRDIHLKVKWLNISDV